MIFFIFFFFSFFPLILVQLSAYINLIIPNLQIQIVAAMVWRAQRAIIDEITAITTAPPAKIMREASEESLGPGEAASASPPLSAPFGGELAGASALAFGLSAAGASAFDGLSAEGVGAFLGDPAGDDAEGGGDGGVELVAVDSMPGT